MRQEVREIEVVRRRAEKNRTSSGQSEKCQPDVFGSDTDGIKRNQVIIGKTSEVR